MSKKLITDSFPVKKHTQPITKEFPQTKINKKQIKKHDQQGKEHPDAKDVSDLAKLRDFDLRCEYGPCTGITRLERWNRAQDHDLEPPIEVKEILEEHKSDTRFTECIWHDEELL